MINKPHIYTGWWTSINHWPHNNNNNNNKNNNKAFKSQTSWGRLELKPSRSNQGSGTWIAVFQALLSKAKSLGIFHHFKSPFIASTQVNFSLPLPLFTLLSWLRIPLRTGASGGLRWTCPNHLNRCWTSFSSIGATPNLSRISSFRTRSLLMTTNPTQHTHFRDTYLLNMLSFRKSTFCTIQHSRCNRRPIKLAF